MLIIICSVWRHKIYLKCMEESKQSYKSTEQSMKKDTFWADTDSWGGRI